MRRRCSVAGCNSGSKTDTSGVKKKFYRILLDPATRLSWMEALRWNDSQDVSKSKIIESKTVCSLHFPADVAAEKRDNFNIPMVPPTLNLGIDKPQPHLIIESADHECEQSEREAIDRIMMFDSDKALVVLKKEYLRLYEKFQQIKELARLDLDLLSLSLDFWKAPDAKAEWDRVYKLVHAVMKEEIYPQIDVFDQDLYRDASSFVDMDFVDSFEENMRTNDVDLVENSSFVTAEKTDLESQSENGDDEVLSNLALESLGSDSHDDRLLNKDCTKPMTEDENDLSLTQTILECEGKECNDPLTESLDKQGESTEEDSLQWGSESEDDDVPLANFVVKKPQALNQLLCQMTSLHGQLLNKVYTKPMMDDERDLSHTQSAQVPTSQSPECEDIKCDDPLTESLEKQGESTVDDSIQTMQDARVTFAQDSKIKPQGLDQLLDQLISHHDRLLNKVYSTPVLDTENDFSGDITLPTLSRPTLDSWKKLSSSKPKKRKSTVAQRKAKNDKKGSNGPSGQRVTQTDNAVLMDGQAVDAAISSPNLLSNDAPSFLCVKCGDTLQDRQSFTKHMRDHGGMRDHGRTEKKGRLCPICGKMLMSKQTFEDHMELHSQSPVNSLPCNICGKKFRTKRYLVRHVRLHNRPLFHCDVCGMHFFNERKLSLHRNSHFGILIKCSSCGEEFGKNKAMAEHMLTHPDLLSCILCGKKFDSSPALQAHVKSIHIPYNKAKLYTCSFCKEQFFGSQAMAQHMLTHPEDLLSCILCPRAIFNSALDVQAHISSKHLGGLRRSRGGSRIFKCYVCSEIFPSSFHLHNHRAYHKSSHPFKCKDCGKHYSTSCSLRTHVRSVHLKVRVYACKICGKTFNWNTTYKRHVQRHRGIKSWKCDVCEKSFSDKTTLNQHMWTHRADKKYNCEKCPRGFNDKRHLISHMKKEHPVQQDSSEENHAQIMGQLS